MPGGRDAQDAAVLCHGTAVAIGPRGVLIRGRSGAGKSDLALRALCMQPTAAFPDAVILIADDQVMVSRDHGRLWMEAPAALRGHIEVRGVGIVALSPAAVQEARVPLVLVVDLVSSLSAVERLPEPDMIDVAGVNVRRVLLYPFEASAVLKMALAAQAVAL